MPSDAFIQAASAANRQPVVWLAVESVDAIERIISGQSDFNSCTLTNINTTYDTASVRLATDDPNPIAVIETLSAQNTGPYVLTSTYNTRMWIDSPVICARANTTGISITYIKDTGVILYEVILQGRLNGGSWTDLAEYAVEDGGSGVRVLTNASIERGSWEFRLRADVYVIEPFIVPASIVVFYVFGYYLTYESRYLNGSIVTADARMDLGLIPEIASQFMATDDEPAGTSIVYTAQGRNDSGDSWTSLGTIRDGDKNIPPYRYYKITATLTASADFMSTPTIDNFRLVGGDSQYTHFSTRKDTPITGAWPYIVPGGVSGISSRIDLYQQATVGELSIKLFWRKKTADIVAGDYLKNKIIICKIGFVGLADVDYEPYFVGTWYDYQADSDKGIITVKTRNILKRFDKKVPAADYFVAGGGAYTSKTYSGNVMDVMMEIAEDSGIPDRLIDLESFIDIGAGDRSGTDWNVSRTIASPTEAMEMLNELAVSSGVFLFEGADGRLVAKLYDQFSIAAEAGSIDAAHYKFKPIDGGQKDLYTRQAIYWDLITGKDGGSTADYNQVHLKINADSETLWEESTTREWKDRWNLTENAITALADRWDSWSAKPRAAVRVDDLPPRFYGIERGAVVLVNNLQMPCPAAFWPGYTVNTRFLVLGKSISDPTSENLTVSLDLMMLEDPLFSNVRTLPNYHMTEFNKIYWAPITAAGIKTWGCAAISADGSKIFAGTHDGTFFTSDDSGQTWTEYTTGIETAHGFYALEAFADDVHLVIMTDDEYVYVSDDAGVTWTQKLANSNWSLAVSVDAQFAYIGKGTGLYQYNNYGDSNSSAIATGKYSGVTCSADGTKIAACLSNGYIITTINYGINWVNCSAAGSRYWSCIAGSTDGVQIYAAVGTVRGSAAATGYIYASSDSGVTWSQRATDHDWNCIDCSADGTFVIAAVAGGFVYISQDSGATWTEQATAGSRSWTSVKCTPDGTRAIAADSSGYLYAYTA